MAKKKEHIHGLSSKARRAFDNDEFCSARKLYRNVEALEKIQSPEDIRKFAYCLIENCEFFNALALLLRWERKAPKNPVMYSMKGFTLDKLDRFDEAEEAWRSSLSIKPRASGYCLLGGLLKKRGDVTGASACYQEALALDSDYEEARLALEDVATS